MSERYTEKRLNEDFTVYILFEDQLEASFAEVLDAAAEDYPALDWTFSPLGPFPINTRQPTIAVDTTGQVKIIGMPGRCDVDWTHAVHHARLTFPQAEEVIARHTDYIGITFTGPEGDTSTPARFRAAQYMTCLSAVLAKLPIASAVYFPSATAIMPPERWVRAADQAVEGKVPVLEWITFAIHAFDEPPEPLPITVSTIGLAAFLGRELVMPRVRLPFPEAVTFMCGASSMVLDADHTFRDGDTMGLSSDDKAFRIRECAEGQHGAQTDQWWFFHTSTDLDHIELFGESKRPAPPPDMDNSFEGDFETLRQRLSARLQ